MFGERKRHEEKADSSLKGKVLDAALPLSEVKRELGGKGLLSEEGGS